MGVFLFQTKAPEFFGSFSASFFTMFTISTVDGWVDVVYVAAPETLDWGKVYFIAYIVVVVWTLLPVIPIPHPRCSMPGTDIGHTARWSWLFCSTSLPRFHPLSCAMHAVMAKDKDRVRRARMPAFKPVTSSVLDPILKVPHHSLTNGSYSVLAHTIMYRPRNQKRSQIHTAMSGNVALNIS
eukprot:3339811-Rhodomonas_salina.1